MMELDWFGDISIQLGSAIAEDVKLVFTGNEDAALFIAAREINIGVEDNLLIGWGFGKHLAIGSGDQASPQVSGTSLLAHVVGCDKEDAILG